MIKTVFEEDSVSDLKYMLPGEYYTSAEIYERELERFFYDRWVCVGRTQEISSPGQFIVKEVGKESILIVCDGTKPRAFYNLCRHRGTRLCETNSGTLVGRIQCPYHAWTYACDGSLVAAPGMSDVSGFDRGAFGLNALSIDEWDGHLFVHFGSSPISLLEQIGALKEKFSPWGMANLKVAKRQTYRIAANWKLIIQNYSECLHCPVIHPALAKLSHYLSGDNEPMRSTFLGGRMTLNDGVKSMTLSGQTERSVLPGLRGDLKRQVYYYWVMPNLLLSLHPDYMMTHLLWPKGTGETEIVCEFHFHPSEISKPGFTAEDAFEFWDLTNRQDWHVSELTQLGVGSRGFVPGPYTNRESLLVGLDAIVRE